MNTVTINDFKEVARTMSAKMVQPTLQVSAPVFWTTPTEKTQPSPSNTKIFKKIVESHSSNNYSIKPYSNVLNDNQVVIRTRPLQGKFVELTIEEDLDRAPMKTEVSHRRQMERFAEDVGDNDEGLHIIVYETHSKKPSRAFEIVLLNEYGDWEDNLYSSAEELHETLWRFKKDTGIEDIEVMRDSY